ncbi:MAG: endonuclease III [Synergistales bacterium]|nr:endonuclease III [Synergistales bacterium]
MITDYARTFDYDGFMEELEAAFQGYGKAAVRDFVAMKRRDPFRVLIGTILSSRTKDEVTSVASERLFAEAPDTEALAALPEVEIEELIYPVGFYKTKAKHLQATARMLLEHYGGEVPSTLAELLKLPGVGRKTANLVLGEAFGTNAICVDTHVHRISNRVGLVETGTPQETERDLEAILPERYWIRYNYHLVAHGQEICKPISPYCSRCALTPYCRRIGVARSR